MYQYHKWLRSFHAVAKTGSFTLAAEFLSVGQPTVSEQVNALERKFSVELFHRRGRFVEMSAAGHQLYAITQGLFGQEDEAVQLLQSFKQRKLGMLRLGAVSPPIAMNLTYELMQRHPDIELETSFSPEKETLDRLFNFDIDVAILALPTGAVLEWEVRARGRFIPAPRSRRAAISGRKRLGSRSRHPAAALPGFPLGRRCGCQPRPARLGTRVRSARRPCRAH